MTNQELQEILKTLPLEAFVQGRGWKDTYKRTHTIYSVSVTADPEITENTSFKASVDVSSLDKERIKYILI